MEKDRFRQHMHSEVSRSSVQKDFRLHFLPGPGQSSPGSDAPALKSCFRVAFVPFAMAMCAAVRPFVSSKVGRAPIASSTSIVTSQPANTAQCSALWPCLSVAFGSALSANNTDAVPWCPRPHARCSGVRSLWSRTSTWLGSRSSRSTTRSLRFKAAASCSAEVCSAMRRFSFRGVSLSIVSLPSHSLPDSRRRTIPGHSCSWP
mmetsp:Transcript_30627/g.91779  ORF Transcript_30627/g.91779 Transcript_30627/m.91779 type:complete len:204 (-) Transcript_30627:9-620(-)